MVLNYSVGEYCVREACTFCSGLLCKMVVQAVEKGP